MRRRDLILEEMGITPLWRLRATDVQAADESQAPVASPSADALPPRSAETMIVGSDAAPATTPWNQKAVASAPNNVDTDERRSIILKMEWDDLKTAVAQCLACPLHAKRNKTVFGVGDERASWLFVGEGPGAEEDAKGEPFVGQAGRLLDNMLAALDMKRGTDVYIANVVKCRPPNNRNPESGEMSCCEPYLTRQIELIQPKLIVAMGKIAASHLLQTDASIASLRGRVHAYRGTPLIVTYHPAYLLRTLADKAKSWADLCFARDRMDAIVAAQTQDAG